MVKYGRHLQSYRERTTGYVVPYRAIKGVISNATAFNDLWHEALNQANHGAFAAATRPRNQ